MSPLNEKETPEELTKTLNPSLKLMNKLDSYLSGL